MGKTAVFPHSFRRLLAYDASGQRVMTVEPSGKTTYFPFPGYSEEMVGTSVTARRVTYTIAGQAVASRVQTFSPAGNTLYRLYTDHLGSTVTQSTLSGGAVGGTNTYYLPYGSYRGTPPTQTLTDRDFTGQRENRELGLLYYQARFYVPSIGRFASADTIVPDPANPQQFNRYTYSLNSPLRYSDPTGHIACEDIPSECQVVDEKGTADWSVSDYSTEDWRETAIKVARETLVETVKNTPMEDIARGKIDWPDWTYSRLFPDYGVAQVSIGPVAIGLVIDDYSNVYLSAGLSLGPESIAASGRTGGGWVLAQQLPSQDGLGLEWNLQRDSPNEQLLEQFHTGLGLGGGAGFGTGIDVNLATGLDSSLSFSSPTSLGLEGGLYTPQIGGGGNWGWLLYDNGSNRPWIWQQ